MDRRKSIKALAVGTLSAGILLDACKTDDKKVDPKAADGKPEFALDRFEAEKEGEHQLMEKPFFTPEEMATITVLADIIIPKDEISGSASDAKVPDFIDFIVKDKPEHQVPMRGGLRWLDVQCLKQFNKSFKDCTEQQRIAMVDQIAYPKKAKKEMAAGVAFFNLMRDLTATGFYTSQIGVKDIGYVGNSPNKWNGVPDDVLKQYGLAYSERELKECASYK
jgi:gluconate 2-dehydrogenase subunit 3-like protein